MIIADASLLANLLIPGLDLVSAEAVRSRDSDWRAPGLWPYEFRNTLLKYIKADRLSQLAASNLIGHALQIMGSPGRDAASSDTLATAVTFGLSSYDAEYVAFAKTLGVPLVTFDRRLAKAAPGIAFRPDEYLALR